MMRPALLCLLLALACGGGSSDAGPDAAAALADAGPLPPRLLTSSVVAGGPEFVSIDGFRDCLDAMQSNGIRDLHLFAAVRNRCSACGAGGQPLDVDTWPARATYDFSWFFDRLDVAIREKGMRVILSVSLSGRLDSDPQAPYAFLTTLPARFTADDLMMIRDGTGADVVYVSPNADAEALAFEKPAVRAEVLDYATAVVTQFRQRYGDWIMYYSFTTNTTSENEYPLSAGDTYADTSPHAAAAFRTWLAAHYASPGDVSTAWGRTPAFTDFAEIEILDGLPPPAVGEAPRSYLDFMAYREAALGSFLSDVRDRVHDAGGRAMAQYGSVFDWITPWRGSHRFGSQAAGFDLVLVDDAPGYPHAYSMDYVRSNGGLPFGNEVDSPCSLGCSSGDLASCCDIDTFPDGIDPDLGAMRMDAQVDLTYAGGAALLDLANWDFYYQSAFPLYADSLDHAVVLAGQERTEPVPVATQTISLRELYRHHGDPSYVDSLVEAHDALEQDGPVAVRLQDDLDP
jgi:hypothetical protein